MKYYSPCIQHNEIFIMWINEFNWELDEILWHLRDKSEKHLYSSTYIAITFHPIFQPSALSHKYIWIQFSIKSIVLYVYYAALILFELTAKEVTFFFP